MDKEIIKHLERMIDWTIALSGDKPLSTLKWDIAQAEAAMAMVNANKHSDHRSSKGERERVNAYLDSVIATQNTGVK